MKRLFIFFILLFSAPVVLTPVLPMQDLPSHVAAVSIHTELASGSEIPAAFFERQSPWRPYNSFYIMGILLSPLLDPAVSARLFVLGALWLYGYVLWRIARRTRSAFPLLALPFFFNITYYSGMVNFLLGLPVFLILAHRMWNSLGRFSSGNWYFSIIALQVVAFLVHPVAYVLFLVLAVLVFLQRLLAGRAVLRPALIGFAAPLAAASVWIRFGFGLETGAAADGNAAVDFHLGSLASAFLNADWTPGQLLVNQLIDAVLLPFGPYQQAVQGALLALLMIAAAAVFSHAKKAERSRAETTDSSENKVSSGPGAGFVIWLGFLFATLLLPFTLLSVTYVSTRSLTFALPLLVVLGKPAAPMSRTLIVRILASVFLVASAVNLTIQHYGYSGEAEGGVALAEEVPTGGKLLGLVVSGKSAWVSTVLDPFLHIHHLHAAESGGFVSAYPVQPLFVVTPIAGSGPPFPESYEPGAFSWAEHGVHYDRILVRMSREHVGTTAVGRYLGRELIPRTNIDAADGDWLLLKPKN